jgi:hypothetical protein
MLKMILPFYLGYIFTITSAYAELNSAGENRASIDLSRISLPKCVEDATTIKNIEETMKTNRKSKNKYNGYREALQSSSDLELASRLAYAEVLAAKCNGFKSQIVRPIVEVISNRIAIRNNDTRNVIFERDQFASSLNKYNSSHYKDFLCPRDLKLWQDVQNQMEIAVQKTKGVSQRLLPRDAVHYYFFQHDTKFTPPEWAEGTKAYKQAEFKDSTTVKDCVKFYRNEKWK